MLATEYLEVHTHIALEQADENEDRKSFDHILSGVGPLRKVCLLKFMESTEGLWNFKAT